MSTVATTDKAFHQAEVALRENVSLSKIAEILAADSPAPAVVVTATPVAPQELTITPEVRDALQVLPAVFGAVQPTERRVLTEKEISALATERETIKVLIDLMSKRESTIKEAIRNHVDVDAEASGLADEKTPRDPNGHYILCAPQNPTRLPIPETNQDWSIEFTSGKITISAGELDALYEAGDISREDYLAFTREKRVFDESKATSAILADPTRLSIIKKITKRSSDNTSLTVRKRK